MQTNSIFCCDFVSICEMTTNTYKTMIVCNYLMCQLYGASLSHFVGLTHQLGLQPMRDPFHEKASTSQYVVFVSLYLTSV